MTLSKPFAERKNARFQRKVTRRGSVPETSVKIGYDYPVCPNVLGFIFFVVVGSSQRGIKRAAGWPKGAQRGMM